MIRSFQPDDLKPVMQIWLDGNCSAHPFVPQSYWDNQFDDVAQALPQAEVYVYEKNREIVGFVGLMDHYIAGIFVQDPHRSHGIGQQLLDHVKRLKSRLTLHVYQKNQDAVRFYLREGFQIQSESIQEDTGEREYAMFWDCCSPIPNCKSSAVCTAPPCC